MSSSPEPRSEVRPGGAFEVRLAGTGLSFPVAPGEPILGAARRAGVWLPFECGWGSCGTCKATLIDGRVTLLHPGAPAIGPQDARRRRTLTCQATADSDLTLKVLRTGPDERRPTRDHRAELRAVDALGPGISRFRFQLDAPARYLPGQYAILELGGGLRRCYSMTGPAGTDGVEFIAKHYPGRPGSSALFGLSPGDRITAELPYGDMWLRPGDHPVVLTAGGTGISAILALLRQLSAGPGTRAVHVFYGANTEDELVCLAELRTLVARLPAARLHAAVAEAGPSWPGTTGRVTDALRPPLPGLVDADHYLAGPPVMVDAVLALLGEHQVPVDRIHHDRFG